MVEAQNTKVPDSAELPAGYRLTELGPLPEEWRVVRLGDLENEGYLWVKNGYPQGEHNTEGNGVPHLRPFNITSEGIIDVSQIKFVDAPPEDSSYWVKCGDVLFNNTNSEELVGKTAYFDLNGKFVLSNHMTIIRVADNTLDAYWLAKQLHWFWYEGLFHSICRRHVNQASVSLERLRQVCIPLPPLPEQRAIAYVLRTVQEAKEATERVIAALRQLKKSLMRHLFTYGPVPIDQADQVPMQDTQIGPLPAHWQVMRLGEVAIMTSGGTPDRKNPSLFQGNIPWVKSGELKDSLINQTEEYISEEGLASSNAKIFRSGTLLVAMYGATAGKVGILNIEAATNQAICAIFPKREALFDEWYTFFALIFRRESLKAERYGGAQPNLSQKIIRDFSIPLPPLAEQRVIARILQAVDEKIRAEEARKAALEGLFRSLLHHLMTAQVRLLVGAKNVSPLHNDLTQRS